MERARVPGTGHGRRALAVEVEAMHEVRGLPEHRPGHTVRATRGTHAGRVPGVGRERVDLPIVVHARAELRVVAELVAEA